MLRSLACFFLLAVTTGVPQVEKRRAGMRPRQPQVPVRDLKITRVRPLGELDFNDADAVGVKAANLAVLRRLSLPAGVVPDGYAVPFYFYDEFMKHNGFYDYARQMIARPAFQDDPGIRESELARFRKLIKKGKMPEWMLAGLEKLHGAFPAGTNLRCRASTNNEELPGFSGAGLYDSYTHHADEGHLAKSIQQVYASMWNLRAFEERDVHRIDHFAAAMGVLVHPNFAGELVSGVAFTDDVRYGTRGNYYVTARAGEGRMANSETPSPAEELLVDWWNSAETRVMRTSGSAAGDAPLLSARHLELLRRCLGAIHARFADLHGKSLADDDVCVEIEFKVTADRQLVIKQARRRLQERRQETGQPPQRPGARPVVSSGPRRAGD